MGLLAALILLCCLALPAWSAIDETRNDEAYRNQIREYRRNIEKRIAHQEHQRYLLTHKRQQRMDDADDNRVDQMRRRYHANAYDDRSDTNDVRADPPTSEESNEGYEFPKAEGGHVWARFQAEKNERLAESKRGRHRYSEKHNKARADRIRDYWRDRQLAEEQSRLENETRDRVAEERRMEKMRLERERIEKERELKEREQQKIQEKLRLEQQRAAEKEQRLREAEQKKREQLEKEEREREAERKREKQAMALREQQEREAKEREAVLRRQEKARLERERAEMVAKDREAEQQRLEQLRVERERAEQQREQIERERLEMERQEQKRRRLEEARREEERRKEDEMRKREEQLRLEEERKRDEIRREQERMEHEWRLRQAEKKRLAEQKARENELVQRNSIGSSHSSYHEQLEAYRLKQESEAVRKTHAHQQHHAHSHHQHQHQVHLRHQQQQHQNHHRLQHHLNTNRIEMNAVPHHPTPKQVHVILSIDEVRQAVQQGETWMVLIYAPWCGHSRRAIREYPNVAADMVKVTARNVTIAAFNVKNFEHSPLPPSLYSRYVPTLRLFAPEINNYVEYDGHISSEHVVPWLNYQLQTIDYNRRVKRLH